MTELTTATGGGMLSREEMDAARERLPIVYVDVVPVRVDDQGTVIAAGLLLNLSFWPFTTGLSGELSFVAGAPLLDNLHRFLVFTLATSLGWDIMRAVTTAVLILVTGRAVLGALRRAARRAAFEEPVTFVVPPGPSPTRRADMARSRP